MNVATVRRLIACVAVIVALASLAAVYGLPRDAMKRSSPADEAPWFEDMTDAVGISFSNEPVPEDSFEMPQIMGFGGGLFDADNDGDLDVLLIGGGKWPLPVTDIESSGRLYLQEPDGKFSDATSRSGLDLRGNGMGMAIGDVDNDGDLDVFLSNYGDDQLFVNDGQGRFSDHTSAAGVSNPNWSTAASFFDYDRDGWLDLIVVNYVDYFPGSPCYDRSGLRDFCGPQAFGGTVDRLYRNQGASADDGGPRFVDVTHAAGLIAGSGRGLGVICADVSGDHRPDMFVANDMEPNRLWIQQADGSFQDEASLRGVAVNQWGRPEANMGVAFDDFSGDGELDLFVTHLRGETNTLWQAEGNGLFADRTPETGLGPPSLPSTGFGVAGIDLEFDGDLDIVAVNGHVKRPGLDKSQSPRGDTSWQAYAQSAQVFVQHSSGHFNELGQQAGSLVEVAALARGLALGDLDRDGDQDLLVTTARGRARLLRNNTPRSGAWVQIRAFDPVRHRDAYGARVTVVSGAQKWTRVLLPSSSYLSHHQPLLQFGVGSVARIDRIVVEWPDGDTAPEVFPGCEPNRRIVLQRGRGRLDSGRD